MSLKGRRFRPYLWPLSIVALAIVLIGISYNYLPKPVAWFISLFVTSVSGGLLTRFVPRNIRDRAEYHVNRLKMWWEDPNIEVTFAVNYSLDSPESLDNLSEGIQSEFGTAPTTPSGERFEINENGMTTFINLDRTVPSSNQRGITGGLQRETTGSHVSNIRVRIKETDTNYSTLRQTLEDMREFSLTLSSRLGGTGHADGYSITCAMEDPALISKFMAQFNMETLQATTEEGVDVEFGEWEDPEEERSGKEIRLRNMNGAQLSTMINKVVDIVTHYG